LSAYWFDSTRDFPGNDALFPDGYDAIIDVLADGIPVATRQRVTGIAWDRRGVIVTTTSSRFTGSHVLVTVPLGVLAAGSIAFSPGLPEGAASAIAGLGSGSLNKVFLRFNEVFWDSDVDWIELVPGAGPAWVEWVNLSRVTGQPVLLAFAAGDLGRQVDDQTDAAVVKSAMSALQSMYGPDVPAPVDWRITRWGSDPYAAGSYSFNAVGSDPEMRDALATPIDGRLFFAGEATDRWYFGTVHGAYLSGVRAAQDILNA
jgi:monoamine oxidase